MKTLKLLLLIVFIYSNSQLYSQTGFVNNGAKVTIGSESVVKVTGTNGHLINENGGTINLDGKIEVGGNIENNNTTAPIFVNANGIGQVYLNGDAEQSINGTGYILVENLIIENSNDIQLNTNLEIANDINLISGNLFLNNYDILLLQDATISGALSSSNMVVTNGDGFFNREITNTGIYDFPVGSGLSFEEFTPAEIEFISGTFTDGVLGVRSIGEKHPENPSQNDYLNRYWVVQPSGIANYEANVYFNYASSDVVGNETAMHGALWNGTGWNLLAAASANAFSGNVIEFGDFTAGEQSALINTQEIENNYDVIIYAKDKTIFVNANEEVSLPLSIEVFNGVGQMITEKTFLDHIGNINMSNYSEAYYYIRIHNNENNWIKKVYIH